MGKYWGFGLIFFAGGVLLLAQHRLEFSLPAPAEAQSESSSSQTQGHPENSESLKLPASWPPATEDEKIDAFIKRESEQVGLLNPRPDLINRHLDALAGQLNHELIQKLASNLENQRYQGDQQAWVLDVLARSDLQGAGEALLEQTLQSSESMESDLMQQMALEGLLERALRQKDPTELIEVAKKSDQSFLVRRARQGIEALQGRAPWPQDSDFDTLSGRRPSN